MENPILAAALTYASMGWHVFPCRPGSKAPATPRGLHDATTDEATIRAWWEENPKYNVAINCGASGLAVVDLDCKNGIDGQANWNTWCASTGTASNGTTTARTPSGGWHLYYLGTCRNSASILAPGVDTRGVGGYVLAAPSIVGGAYYNFDPTSPPSPLPLPATVATSLAPKVRQKSALPITRSFSPGSLSDLVQDSGFTLSKKGTLNEYCGPCPWCGGHDRFVVGWEGEGRDQAGRYYCRRCERKGDSVSWLVEQEKMSPAQAIDNRNAPHGNEFRPESVTFEPYSEPVSDQSVPEPWDRYLTYASEMIEEPPPPTAWDVDGFIEAGSLVVCYGKPGSLKSMLIADMALSVAAGRMWLPPSSNGGNPPIGVRSSSVGWIDLDNGKRRTHHRVHSLAKGANITNPDLLFWSFPPCDLTKPNTLRMLEKIIRKYSLRILVIDTLINSMNVKNENDNSELRAPLLALRTLVEATNCTIIAIHHPKKGMAVGRMSDDLRGGGAIAGALDIAIRIEREEGSTRVKAIATKTRGDDIGDIHAEFTVTRNFSGDMETASFNSIASFSSNNGIEIIQDLDYHAKILSAIDGEMGANEIFRTVKGGKQKFTDAMRFLEAEGTLSARQVGQKRLYKHKEGTF